MKKNTFTFLSSVILLTKEWSSLRVCSRSNIAGDDLTFEIKSAIGATPEHSLENFKKSFNHVIRGLQRITNCCPSHEAPL
jgi:hypothetical protein